MPGADLPLPPPEPFQEQLQPVEQPQQQQPEPEPQPPLSMPLREELLQQQRLSLKEEDDNDVQQATPTTTRTADTPDELSPAVASTKGRLEAFPTNSTIDEHEDNATNSPLVSQIPFPVADMMAMDTDDSDYNSRNITSLEKLISYLLGRFSMLHQEGSLEEAAATLQQALSIMEGRREKRRDGARAATAAVESNLPDNKSFSADYSVAGEELNTPHSGAKEMEGASRDEDGVERENSDTFGSRFGPDREFLPVDKNSESSAVATEASAIAGVMNDLGCTLQQVIWACLFVFLAWLFANRFKYRYMHSQLQIHHRP